MNRQFLYGLWLLLATMVTTMSLSAQLVEARPQRLYCVDGRYEALSFPGGDSTALSSFYAKMDRLLFEGSGKLNILHIGGSHVQAGILPNRVREHFMTLYPEISAGRGLIFPYKVAKTNNPPNYEVQYQGQWTPERSVNRLFEEQMGVNGITVTTTDVDAEIRVFINRNKAYTTDFNKLVVMGYEIYGCYEPYIFAVQEQVSTYSTPLNKNHPSSVISKVETPKTTLWNEMDTICGVYDEQMQTWTFCIDNYADAFVMKFRKKDSKSLNRLRFTLTGFLTENDNNGLLYHSIGVNGASLSSYLKCENFGRDMALLKPDLVIFGIGINDATMPDFSHEMFCSRYDSLIGQIEAISPDCNYLFMTNNDSYTKRTYPNKNGLVAQEAFCTLAQRHHAALWDVFGLMGGLGSATEWEYAGLMKADLVHFTVTGYELLGDMLYRALMDDYVKHLKTLNRSTK